jgi:hypothetical protein
MTQNGKILSLYLDLLDQQTEEAFQSLKGLSEAKIWQRLMPDEWCIGEILDHTRAIHSSVLPLLRVAWFFGRSLAQFRQRLPYPVEIDDVYHRQSFPMNAGWIWPPKYTPNKPAPLATLRRSIHEIHQKYRRFYEGKNPNLLGHIRIYDPVLGRMNLILVLRVGVYHDQLHFQDVIKLAAELRQHTTPVA